MILPGWLLVAFPTLGAVTDGWVQRYTNPTTRLAEGQAIKVVVDSAGNVVVTGFIVGDLNPKDMLTIKYSGADGSILWQKHFVSGYQSEGTAIALDHSGNVIVTSFADGDYYTAKYAAPNGATLWERRFSGPVGEDFPKAVAVDALGNVVVTGYSDNGLTNGVNSRVYYTAKYAAADGALLWEQRYHSPGHYGEGRAVAVDAAGNILVTGSSRNSDGNDDYYTIKYAAADGAVRWDHRYDGLTNSLDRAVAVAVDSSGNAIVTGASHNGRDNDFYTAKYAAANGALLWEKRFNGPGDHEDFAFALAVANDGDVIVTGQSWAGDVAGFDYYTARYAGADGALLWERFSAGPEVDQPTAVAVDSVGNVVVTGYSVNGTTGHDYYTVKYAAADGALLWDKRFNGPANVSDVAYSAAIDNAGNVVVTGFSQGDYDHYYTIKYAAADGTSLWEKSVLLPADYYDYGRAIALDPSGNVVVTGASYRDLNNLDFYTAKYARSTGTILWEKRSDGGDAPSALAVDKNGNVIVTGTSWNDVTGQDFYTVKYAATDGAILWEKYYRGAATNDSDVSAAVVIDSMNDVVVTGYSGNRTNNDCYTAKYAGADGALIWERRFVGPASVLDTPAALALDGQGNVIVTGTSRNQNSTNRTDFYTVKYAAANGAVLWDRRYDGPAKGPDTPVALAVDPAGNVIVTGNSETDYYTAKYAAANGALLWEKRYNGPGNDYDTAYAVAVDVSGNVIVSGTSFSVPFIWLHAIKYAAANGAVLWDRITSAQANPGTAYTMVTDSAGNVFVAGAAPAPSFLDYEDYYVAKLAAANGAVLWEKYYDGPGRQTELLADHGLVVRDGMIALTGTSAGDPPEHEDASISPHTSVLPGTQSAPSMPPVARHVVHYEMATVVFWEKVPPVSIEVVPGGVRLQFAGDPDTTYHIERATVVTGPWDTIATVTGPFEGLTEYLDTAPPTGMSFYRVSTP